MRSGKGTKIRPVQDKQSDSALIWESYSEGFNKKRIFLEFIIPVILSIITLIINLTSESSLTNILINLKIINKDFFTIIAIQIGFNITSLALIGTLNRSTLINAFSKIKEIDKKEKALKQLLSSFIYCVFIQTTIITFGFFYNINIEQITKINFFELNVFIKQIIIYIFYSIWIGVIFHTFMVTIRNVILIYKFILAVFKN